MHAETDRTAGTRRPARGPAVTLGLTLMAVVAVGAAWAGYAGQVDATPRVRADVAVAASPPPVAATDARALLDAGNAAFRAGRDEEALGHYRAATRQAPGDAAPWYGVHMAAQRLGRRALADSAMAAIRARTGDPAAFDAEAMRRAHGAR